MTFDSTVYCGKCPMCLEGKVNLCSDRQVLGVSCEDYNRAGCFAEYVCVPEYILYRMPDNVTFVQAAMIEPLSVAYHAATRTPIKAGDTVVCPDGEMHGLINNSDAELSFIAFVGFENEAHK